MENTTLKTTNGREIVLKAYITARELRELKALYLAVAKFDPKSGEVFDIDPKKAEEIENKTIAMVVVSIDGKEDRILETILDMPIVDYNEIMEKMNDATGLDKKKLV
ncbi:hypothetical protein LCGC14_1354470 [marine sediment metagenome]|uniref:Uncharacterized protein n=1 Tax=marine sediment metagenome TaxID=412755 RepID=A0A0F9MQH2_9ZZZZ